MGATDGNYPTKKKVDHGAKKQAENDDWSNLHQDFISSFAGQITSMNDFFAFRGISRSWRSSAIKENSNAALRLHHKVPVLIFPKKINAPIRNYYSLTKGQIYQLDLPETTDKYCYSSLGWLLTISHEMSDYGIPKACWPMIKEMTLFNPLTHAQIKLPRLPPDIMTLNNLKKFILSSNPSWTSDYWVIVLSYNGLALYKPGYNDNKWTHIPRTLFAKILVDAICYKEQIYAVDYRGGVSVCEIEDPNNARMRFVTPEIPEEQFLGPNMHFQKPCLVESEGTLLLVVFLFEEDCESTTGCRVFNVPFEDENSWEKSEVKNLGNMTLFLGANNSSFSIEALDDSICKANCIYFLNRSHVSIRGDIDIGIYHMKDGKIDKHFETFPDFQWKGMLTTSHVWFQPSF